MVAVATILIAIFILMSERKAPESIKKAHQEVTISKKSEVIEVETEKVASNSNAVEPQANAENKANETSQSIISEVTSSEVTSSEVISSEATSNEAKSNDTKAAPDGPYANKDATTEQIAEADATTHISQPIWMDQKLGDFKSIEKGDVVFKIMPVNADGLQGKNPQGVVTNKSDTYSSNMVSADYNYQQMPMYNGGYYIAPMPSYLMPSILPVKNGN